MKNVWSCFAGAGGIGIKIGAKMKKQKKKFNRFKNDTAIDPNYVYPRDPMKVLVRDADATGNFSYLGTVLARMSRRREDREMMSRTNFLKNHGHEL